MIIDLKSLKQKGLKSKEFTFDYAPPQTLIDLPDGKFDGNAVIKCLVEVYDDEAYVSGNIAYSISTVCSRCLSPTTYVGSIDFDERFISDRSVDKDEDCYTYERDRIDLKKAVDELILTDMPYAVYCRDDCSGLCPHCGKNLNDGDCGCENL